jgi:FlaA1/EpsC-like NDP-sugar epimerase
VLNLGEITDATVVMGQQAPHGLALQVTIYLCVSLALVVGIRAIPKAVQDSMIWSWEPDATGEESPANAVVYGAGRECEVFLSQQGFRRQTDQEQLRIVGLLDDDRNLHGRYVHGYRVLGGMRDLEHIGLSHGVKAVVVAEPLPDEAGRALLATAKARHMRVFSWKTTLERLDETPPSRESP